jgi:hypothetical protein
MGTPWHELADDWHRKLKKLPWSTAQHVSLDELHHSCPRLPPQRIECGGASYGAGASDGGAPASVGAGLGVGAGGETRPASLDWIGLDPQGDPAPDVPVLELCGAGAVVDASPQSGQDSRRGGSRPKTSMHPPSAHADAPTTRSVVAAVQALLCVGRGIPVGLLARVVQGARPGRLPRTAHARSHAARRLRAVRGAMRNPPHENSAICRE